MSFSLLIPCASLRPKLSRCGSLQMGKKTKLAFEITHTSQEKKHRVIVFLYSLPKACHWKAVAVSQPGMDFSKEEFAS